MPAILFSAAVTCFVSLFLGQAALRLAGAREWNWLAPVVGLSVAMLIAAPMEHVPGRAVTVTVLLTVLSLGAAVWCLRSASNRPPLLDLTAAAPVLILALVPFLAAGRGGILGVTVNNDMAVHLTYVEAFLHPAVSATYPLPSDYPIAPHATVAALSTGLSVAPYAAFSGWTMATLLIGAWAVLAAARNAGWYSKTIAATLVGMPYLVAAYYGEGSYKEPAQAALVLAVALLISGCGPRLGRGRWAPLALLVGGVVSVYSPGGLPWIFAILGIWLAGLLAIEAWHRRLREVPGVVRRELAAVGIGTGIFVVSLLPQAHRIYEFITLREGTGIAVSDIGNLVGRLPGWEALGVWGTADFRLQASAAFTGGAWSWFVAALIVFGSFWAFRRGRWMLPPAALAAMLIWKYSDRTQSIYVAAKTLAIASPLLLLVAVQPLVDRSKKPRNAWLVVPLLALVLLFQVARDDLRALRWSPVGPTDHARQLISFRPLIAGKKTLFFGEDEFQIWELAGSFSDPLSFWPEQQGQLRPGKGWEAGHALDFDSLRASTLNEYEWFVTTRDAAASEPPPQLHLVRGTEAFELWRRIGRVGERSILNEGDMPGSTLECGDAEGRAVLHRGGVAAIRSAPILKAVPPAGPNGTVSVQLRLPAGPWQLESPYVSHFPVEVAAPGLRTTLPASLERPGPRLPIGRLTVARPQTVTITFHVGDSPLAEPTTAAVFEYVVAVRAGERDRLVPVRHACGRYVDWYRSARHFR
ncbi:MAG TPA: hypothetical protein VFL77_08715 [Solirubrobacterales bacterium]|nr:hypothetical protein [Solirubrobacterales bacterium]